MARRALEHLEQRLAAGVLATLRAREVVPRWERIARVLAQAHAIEQAAIRRDFLRFVAQRKRSRKKFPVVRVTRTVR